MVGSNSSRDDSQQRKSFLDKQNSSKTAKSRVGSSEKSKSSKTEKSTQQSEKKTERSTANTTIKSEAPSKKLITQQSTASIQSVGRRGPKMSDGTEFDAGPYGYIFSFIFLFVLWGLATMLAIALVWFNFSRLDRQYPIYFGDGSFLGGAPKVSFDPNPRQFLEDGTKNAMSWNIYEFSTYVNYLIRYKQVLKKYSGGIGKQKVKKEEMCKNQTMTRENACKFDRLTDFGECTLSLDNLERGFGYSKGQPCIMLKLNKIVGWVPNLSPSKNKTKCPSGDLCCGQGIKFKCTSNADVKFEYFPKTGIPTCYFPYANQGGYEQPYQMVKLTNITVNRETTIECAPEDSSLNTLASGKTNEARFHILMTKNRPVETVG
ncbi:Sodium/potassium-transporting ATPase subunit beta [Caenorhabditis elegans]|uniref:Sodium/potassium-transporting ATPase subunit beta n=1 Tax=Caenorhabditis elegans TaxID=6239 RepID=Q9XUG9_CAEEL|nr:Sodium/potassium-transporting ATPase subunit beta [Caenorhabditis elegans]CAB05149.1 Sodium/potassium-transporting ATPase subunit beta [Caenorhabditis elegans]|eukprot:NP_501958.1 Na+/K+ ATPase, Beta subunit [Caenorhabditis elegans]